MTTAKEGTSFCEDRERRHVFLPGPREKAGHHLRAVSEDSAASGVVRERRQCSIRGPATSRKGRTSSEVKTERGKVMGEGTADICPSFCYLEHAHATPPLLHTLTHARTYSHMNAPTRVRTYVRTHSLYWSRSSIGNS